MHPYPPHLSTFDYLGKYAYSLTFTTFERNPIFLEPAAVDLVVQQFLRASREERFEITAYCFMPDHVHLLVEGQEDASDCWRFIKAAKQYSGYYFQRSRGATLWQRYGYERVLRDEMERSTTIRYILDNSVEAGLVREPADYAFLGSTRYSVFELVEQAAPRG